MPDDGAGYAIRRVKVWDGATRIFHWSIVATIVFSYVSIRLEWLELHMLSGYITLALLLFRLCWGLAGSESARFTRFVSRPSVVFGYLARIYKRQDHRLAGHNPAGGWMVILMLALLLFQTLTGLGSNDDLFNEGPLAKYLGKHLSDWVSVIHAWNFDLILAAVALHVLAIAFYAAYHRHDLVRPMISGWTEVPETIPAPRLRGPLLALGILLLCALVVFAVSRV